MFQIAGEGFIGIWRALDCKPAQSKVLETGTLVNNLTGMQPRIGKSECMLRHHDVTSFDDRCLESEPLQWIESILRMREGRSGSYSIDIAPQG